MKKILAKESKEKEPDTIAEMLQVDELVSQLREDTVCHMSLKAKNEIFASSKKYQNRIIEPFLEELEKEAIKSRGAEGEWKPLIQPKSNGKEPMLHSEYMELQMYYGIYHEKKRELKAARKAYEAKRKSLPHIISPKTSEDEN